MRKDGMVKVWNQEPFKRKRDNGDSPSAFAVVLEDGTEVSANMNDKQLEVLQASLAGAKVKKAKVEKPSRDQRIKNLKDILGEQ